MTPFRPILLSSLALGCALPALAEVPRVVTDLPVTASLVQQVMGDLGQPGLLLTAGADPHHFQLRPQQAQDLEKADLLIWVGPEMTPWLDRASTSLATDASSLALLSLPQTHLREFAAWDEHEDGHEHSHDHGLVAFAICSDCGQVTEFSDAMIEERLGAWAAKSGFHAAKTTIEIRGHCGACHAH